MKANIADWGNLPQEELYPGIVRQAFAGTGATVVRYTYAPGSVFPMHSHVEEQLTIIHSGRIAFTVGGDDIELHAGQLAVIPAGAPHGARVVGDEAVVSDNYIPSGRRGPLRIEPS